MIVRLSVASEWLKFSQKINTKRAFLAVGFIEGVDFEVFLINQENLKGGRPTEEITMTVQAFKEWAMTCNTGVGKLVRQ